MQNSIPNNKRPPPQPAQSITALSSSSDGGHASNTKYNSTTITTASGGAKSVRVKDQRDVKAKRNEWRITKMVLAIFLSFVVCYLPITISKIVDKDVSVPSLHIISYILIYLSACINPIIYVIMNKQYRQAYKTILMCKPPRMLSFTKGGSSVAGKCELSDSFSFSSRLT
jgi:7 transmembrane receptor (rhodopsin family)